MAPKFLQRLHFDPKAPCTAARQPGAYRAIVQYHPSANTPAGMCVGYVVALVEPFAVEHGASLAAGPAALDLLERIVAAASGGLLDERCLDPNGWALIDEAKDLLDRAKPPLGSVNENGTPRQVPETALPHERGKEN